MNNFKITPSIYCANTLDLKSEIEQLNQVGINWIHFDVMDGTFVNNYGLCPKTIDDIKKGFPNLTIDVHVMANNLINKIALFTNADYLTFHLNSIQDQDELLTLITTIKNHGLKVGLALDLDNEFDQLADYWALIDLVTIMSIKPGFTGQSFEQKTWSKIQQIARLKQLHPNILFQIDGGVRWSNIKQLIDYQLDLIVVGSMLFNDVSYHHVITKLDQVVNKDQNISN